MNTVQEGPLTYLLTLGIVAMEGRGFEYPSDALMAENHRLYVTNKSRNYGERGVRITVLDLESQYYGTFGHYGVEEGYLISPSGITGNNAGHIYVVDDYTNSISTFDLNGTFVRRWGSKGNNSGELNGPSGIACNPTTEKIYVSDTKNHRVQIFDTSGNFLSSLGAPGDGNGEFNLPWGIDVSAEGEIYVADWGNNRVQKFSPDGKYTQTFTCEAGEEAHRLNHPSGVAVSQDGQIYVSDWGNESVKAIESSDYLVQELRGEATLSKWASEFLETNQEEGQARKSANLENENLMSELEDPHTMSAHIEKLFWSPVSVRLDTSGNLYVTESNRHRIQVYSLLNR